MRATPVDPGVRASIAARVVGRERELQLTLAAVEAGCDVVLEGPPGTSKTTMLRAITEEWDIPLTLVEGNADLTPTKLLGHHDPSRVLSEGYVRDAFMAGPLVEAMQCGGFLYIEEFNRSPEDTLNVLLTAMADRRVVVPRLGTVTALPTFRVVASMNPYDNIGSTRLSSGVLDRLCRLTVDYQDDEAEREIVRRRADEAGDDLGAALTRDAVALVRATRGHDELLQGSSVRGAIDLVKVARRLGDARGVEGREHPGYAVTVLDALMLALSGRVKVDEVSTHSAEEILVELWEDHFVLDAARAEPG